MNPIIKADFPDPDVIRVEDTYYMVSTTMHFMPGCVILRSYNLVDWEILTHVYEFLELTDQEQLKGDKCAYGQGMWAASLRYHNGEFYICFVANDTGKAYLFRSENIMGPWHRNEIKGFYHDCSLLFDEDHVYLAYGNKQIYLIELNEELTAPKKGCIPKIIVEDTSDVRLGYEGTHFYRIKDKYYLFFIHWGREENARRTEACFVSDHVEGPYTGGDVLNDDMGYCNQGVAQGGIVDTPEGDWYAILFQDSGAVGRIPVLVPVTFEHDFPVFGIDGKVPSNVITTSTRPNHVYEAVYGDDDFSYQPSADGQIHLNPRWEFNHIPDSSLYHIDTVERAFVIQTEKLCNNVTQSINTLTQRLMYPGSIVSVTVDGSQLCDGDLAGLCLLEGDYGQIGLYREGDSFFVQMLQREEPSTGCMSSPVDRVPAKCMASIPVKGSEVTFRLETDFKQMKDLAVFYVNMTDGFRPIGPALKMQFKLDHFCGCRAGLYCYATKKKGGSAKFKAFKHFIRKNRDLTFQD